MPVHPTAIVSARAEIAPDAEIGPYVVIEPDVVIREGCRIMAGAYICSGTEMGRRNEVHMHAVLGNLPQDRHYKGGRTGLVIGDDNIIRELATVHRGTQEGSKTVVGNGCFLMATAHVAHNCTVGDGAILVNGVLLGGHVEVGERAFISGNAVVHQFTRIGRLVMVAGGTRVIQDVPPFCLTGADGRVKGLNRVGLRRADDITPSAVAELGEAFRVLFRSGLKLDEALKQVEEAPHGPEVGEMTAFVRGSKRGIARPFGSERD